MKKFIAWLKRVFNFLFSDRHKDPVPHEVFVEKSEPISLPEQPLNILKRKKQEVIHRIPPNPYTMPNKSSFRRGLGNVQEIIVWDGEHFPGRWRKRLIFHN